MGSNYFQWNQKKQKQNPQTIACILNDNKIGFPFKLENTINAMVIFLTPSVLLWIGKDNCNWLYNDWYENDASNNLTGFIFYCFIIFFFGTAQKI